MAISVGDKIFIGRNIPNLDAKYGPYVSTQAAFDALGEDGDDVLAVGLTVGIQATPSDPIVEYWFESACDSVDDLVPKQKGSDMEGYATEAYVLSQVTPKAEIEINESSNAMQIIGGGRHASFNVDTDGNVEMMFADPGVYLKTATVPSKSYVDDAFAEYETRIAALEAKLTDYEEVIFSLTDTSGNKVEKVLLGKEPPAPVAP